MFDTGLRRIRLSPSERQFVPRHWPLPRRLTDLLRTEPNVRLAVLYGSLARGEECEESDLDLLVRLRDDGYVARAKLVDRFGAATGRRVQLVSVEQAEEAPLLLADALRDGRVLVDRDRAWPELKRREPEIVHEARTEDDRLEREAWAVLETLGDRRR